MLQAIVSGAAPNASAVSRCAGVYLHGRCRQEALRAGSFLLDRLTTLGLVEYVSYSAGGSTSGEFVNFWLRDGELSDLARDFDTTQLCATLGLDTGGSLEDLEREIYLAMLVSPVPFDFPSYAELAASVSMRKRLVVAARRTMMTFDTARVDRPEAYWHYDEEVGFTLKPGKSLAHALREATQPICSGRTYAFSCYRATEYVMLLALVEELADVNIPLLHALEARWRVRPIASGQFHEVFLREYGSIDAPLPSHFYVPGDRVWFRNPDPVSADVAGYEGSWVIYLGNGQFSNFWDCSKPYTLGTKCLEIFHWRNACRSDADGEMYIDEAEVRRRVAGTLVDVARASQIKAQMMRYRDRRGVYKQGGCIDASRECLRWVCPGTTDLVVPSA